MSEPDDRPVCAVCGDRIDKDLAGEPTHVSTADDDHEPVEEN